MKQPIEEEFEAYREVSDEFGELLRHRHSQEDRKRDTEGVHDLKSEHLALFLRSSRRELELSQEQLAKLTGLSRAKIMALECGLITSDEIDSAWLNELAYALGEDVETFNSILGAADLPSINKPQSINQFKMQSDDNLILQAPYLSTQIGIWRRKLGSWFNGKMYSFSFATLLIAVLTLRSSALNQRSVSLTESTPTLTAQAGPMTNSDEIPPSLTGADNAHVVKTAGEAQSAGKAEFAAKATGDHTCALSTSVGLRCWGSNASGVLDDGVKSEAQAAISTDPSQTHTSEYRLHSNKLTVQELSQYLAGSIRLDSDMPSTQVITWFLDAENVLVRSFRNSPLHDETYNYVVAAPLHLEDCLAVMFKKRPMLASSSPMEPEFWVDAYANHGTVKPSSSISGIGWEYDSGSTITDTKEALEGFTVPTNGVVIINCTSEIQNPFSVTDTSESEKDPVEPSAETSSGRK